MIGYPKYVLEMIRAGEKQYNLPVNYSTIFIASKFLPYIRTLELKKGDILLNIGEIPNKFAFVNFGLLRRCYFNQDGDCCTALFMPEGTFFTDGIMTDRSPAVFMIDALEDTKITFTPMNISERLGYENNEIIKSYFKACEFEVINFIDEWQRFTMKAIDRYKYFLNKYTMLEGRISQQEIASYLGITPVSFSRLKNSLNK